jgi:hypothetical protein
METVTLHYEVVYDTHEVTINEALYIQDITEEAKPFLVENHYIEDTLINANLKVWHVTEPDLCRLVYTLPWGNDQAEHRFWNILIKEKKSPLLRKAGIVHGDVLKIVSDYAGEEDKYIMYMG